MSAAIAVIGHNNPPPDPTPFELSRGEIEGLCMEAKNWLDGAGVQSAEDENAVSLLIEKLRAAIKLADERRTVEKDPYDDAIKEIQGRYNPLIADTKTQKGKAVLALDVCKQAIAPWLKKKDDEQRAEQERLRKIADEQRRQAEEAMQSSHRYDLEAREQAETMLHAADEAEKNAKRAEKAKPQATGGKKAIGLRTVFRPEISSTSDFARYLWTNHPAEMREFLDTMAKRLVDRGLREIPGVTVHEDKVV